MCHRGAGQGATLLIIRQGLYAEAKTNSSHLCLMFRVAYIWHVMFGSQVAPSRVTDQRQGCPPLRITRGDGTEASCLRLEPSGLVHSGSSRCLLLRSHCLALLQLSRIVLWQCQCLTWKETITPWEPSTCFRLARQRLQPLPRFVRFLPGKDMHPWFNRYLLSQVLSGVEKIQG